MTTKATSNSYGTPVVITSIIGMIIGASYSLPTPDLFTLVFGIGIAAIPLIGVLIILLRYMRSRTRFESLFVQIITGFFAGLLTGFICIAIFRYTTNFLH